MTTPSTPSPAPRYFFWILAPLLWLSAAPAEAAKAAEVAYHNGVKGYLAQPSGGGKHPAIILIHEWWGLNDDIRRKADAFADAGYVALAVDMYDGAATTRSTEARRLATGVRKNIKGAFANLRAAVSHLKSMPNVHRRRIASVGWCFGGGWSYEIAKNNLGAAASVIYYGRFNPADDLSKMRTSILGHFAEKDRGILVDDVKTFAAKLKTQHGDHAIFIYPNTHHGFANPNNPIHNPTATRLAERRTLEFLDKHL